MVKSDDEIKNSLVERDGTVPCQETSLPPTARCGIAADNMAPTNELHPFNQHKYKMMMKDDKLIDDYGEAHQQDTICQAHFEIRFTWDEKDDIMSYDDIIESMSRDSALYDGEFWQHCQSIGHQKVSKDHLSYHYSSTNVSVLWKNGDKTD